MSSPRPSTRRRWPVVVAVVAVVVAVPLVAGGIFVWSFSGGWDGIRPAAQPTDDDVVSARTGSADRTRSLHADSVDQVLSASDGTVLATTDVDMCREGMNDWKNHDGYTLSCSRTAATAIQLPRQAAFDDVVRAVEEAVLAQGWEPASTPGPNDEAQEAVLRFGEDAPDSSLRVGISALGYSPIVLPDPVFADWSDGSGEVADVNAAFEAGTGVRILVVNEVTYFED